MGSGGQSRNVRFEGVERYRRCQEGASNRPALTDSGTRPPGRQDGEDVSDLPLVAVVQSIGRLGQDAIYDSELLRCFARVELSDEVAPRVTALARRPGVTRLFLSSGCTGKSARNFTIALLFGATNAVIRRKARLAAPAVKDYHELNDWQT